MKKSKAFSKKMLFLVVAGAISASPAFASLYVSPVTKDSASVNYVGDVVNGVAQQKSHSMHNGNRVVSQNYRNYEGQSSPQSVKNPKLSRTGNIFAQALQQDNGHAMQGQGNVGFGISAYNQTPTILMNQGKDIPLFVAVESIVPDVNSWTVHYDEGMHNLDMTWSGGDTWEGVLNTLAMQNKLFAEINHSERVIGLGKSSNIAKHLAKKVPTVWRADTKKTLRENLKDWTEKAGWELAWDKDLMIDYPVDHGGVFTGDLIGEDGAVDSILSSYRNADVPLKAKFFKKNKVVLVLRGGFEQELSY